MTDREVTSPKETTATLEEYENKHDDFRGKYDGVRYVTKLTTRGTALIPIEEDKNLL